jgi:hypothetical protein
VFLLYNIMKKSSAPYYEEIISSFTTIARCFLASPHSRLLIEHVCAQATLRPRLYAWLTS